MGWFTIKPNKKEANKAEKERKKAEQEHYRTIDQ